MNPYDITFEKAKDVMPNIVTQFLEFLVGKLTSPAQEL